MLSSCCSSTVCACDLACREGGHPRQSPLSSKGMTSDSSVGSTSTRRRATSSCRSPGSTQLEVDALLDARSRGRLTCLSGQFGPSTRKRARHASPIGRPLQRCAASVRCRSRSSSAAPSGVGALDRRQSAAAGVARSFICAKEKGPGGVLQPGLRSFLMYRASGSVLGATCPGIPLEGIPCPCRPCHPAPPPPPGRRRRRARAPQGPHPSGARR